MADTNEHDARDRRMGDQGVPFDAAAQALHMERLQGAHNLLAQQVKASVEGVSTTLHSVQTEVRNIASKLSELAGLQQSHDSNNVAIRDVRDSVSVLNTKLEEWFDDSERKRESWQRTYEAERDRWRTSHVAENQQTRDALVRWTGVGLAVMALGGTVVSGFVWNLNMRFEQQARDSSRIERMLDEERISTSRLRDKTHEVELYLARGGVDRAQPYVSKPQKGESP